MARPLQRNIPGISTSDGAGVRLLRSLGQNNGARVDPFLMLDEFSSENPDDYVAGFPSHPHRGFETVTYMLVGNMLHEDHLGHKGNLRTGGVQWMTAGRGIIHSEMPQQTSGKMQGFQLWVNLPASEKMKPAFYRDLSPEEIPQVPLPLGGTVKVIAGTTDVADRSVVGPVQGLSTAPIMFDVRLPANGHFTHALPRGHNCFVYPFEGVLDVGPDGNTRRVGSHVAGVLADGETVNVSAADSKPAAFMLLAGRPIGEPIAQMGPFVMNTRLEVEQAFRDYETGNFP